MPWTHETVTPPPDVNTDELLLLSEPLTSLQGAGREPDTSCKQRPLSNVRAALFVNLGPFQLRVQLIRVIFSYWAIIEVFAECRGHSSSWKCSWPGVFHRKGWKYLNKLECMQVCFSFSCSLCVPSIHIVHSTCCSSTVMWKVSLKIWNGCMAW